MSSLLTTDSEVLRTLPKSPEIHFRGISGNAPEAIAAAPTFSDALDIQTAQLSPDKAPTAPEALHSDPIPVSESAPAPENSPKLSPSTPSVAEPTPKQDASQPAAVLPSTYTILKNDTLSEIAYSIKQQLGSNTPLRDLIQRLAADNGIQNPDFILPGMRLQLEGLYEAAGVQLDRTPAAQPQVNADPRTEMQVHAQRAAQARPAQSQTLPPPVMTRFLEIPPADSTRRSERDTTPAQSPLTAPANAAKTQAAGLRPRVDAQTAMDREAILQRLQNNSKLLDEVRQDRIRRDAQQASRLNQQAGKTTASPWAAVTASDSQDSSAALGGPATWPAPTVNARSTGWQQPQATQPDSNGFASLFGSVVTESKIPASPVDGASASLQKPGVADSTLSSIPSGPAPGDLFGTKNAQAISQFSTKPSRGMVGLYAHEQLLDNPGGDAYTVNDGIREYAPGNDEATIGARVGKDLRDAGENLKRLAGDLGMGSTSTFRDDNGQVVTKERRGLVGALADFAKDFTTGITFGAFNPNNEELPDGMGRIAYGFKKIGVDAVAGDLLGGVPSAFVHAAEDDALAGVNTFEVLPDATIGNFSAGKKATSVVFETAQVAVNGLSDAMPGGDAWARVYAAGNQSNLGIPVVSNITSPESNADDPRYAGVTNTGFRKGVETVGSLLGSVIVGGPTSPAVSVGTSVATAVGREALAQSEPKASGSTSTLSTAGTGELEFGG